MRRISTGLEVCGAAAVVAGVLILFGVGVALIVGGVLAVVFGVAAG